MLMDRRQILKSVGGAAVGFGAGLIGGSPLTAFAAEAVTLPFANGPRPLVTFPASGR